MQANGVQRAGRLPGGGLKLQQSATGERRILSDISNSNKALPTFGTPRPSPKSAPIFEDFRPAKENLPPKAGQSQTLVKKPARVPLRAIVNGSQVPPPARENLAVGVKQIQKPKVTDQKKKSVKSRLTAEQMRQADEWAKEDISIERTPFTGHDMDVLREKIMQAEIEETVAMVRNYTGCPMPSLDKHDMDQVESIYFEDGRLKPDPDLSFEEDSEYEMDTCYYLNAEDPILSLSSGVDEYDAIPSGCLSSNSE